jgi:hypothetical protein
VSMGLKYYAEGHKMSSGHYKPPCSAPWQKFIFFHTF